MRPVPQLSAERLLLIHVNVTLEKRISTSVGDWSAGTPAKVVRAVEGKWRV